MNEFKIEQELFTRLIGKEKVVTLPLGWFAISSNLFPDKGSCRLAHGKWYKISHKSLTSDEEYVVYRILRFAPHLLAGKSGKSAEIVKMRRG